MKYFYDRITCILGANFRFRANIQGIFSPPFLPQYLLSKHKGRATIRGKYQGYQTNDMFSSLYFAPLNKDVSNSPIFIASSDSFLLSINDFKLFALTFTDLRTSSSES